MSQTTHLHLRHRGLVPSTQLGTGTASASNFLRGDQQWHQNYVESITASSSNRFFGQVDIRAGTGVALAVSSNTITISSGVGATSQISVVLGSIGQTLTAGVKGYLDVQWPGIISAAEMLADQSGSVVVDIWKDTYANHPPTVADTITAAAKPTIASATKSLDTTLTGWTTVISAGDVLGYNVDSVTSIQQVTVTLKVTRT